jgi:hypothetical protein
MSHPIVEAAFEEFSEIGKRAVVVELKIRLLANKIPDIQSYAHAKHIVETENALLPYLVEQGLISEQEKKHLELSRRIRNKIFHCEFESAVKLVEELRGEPMSSGAVKGAKLDEVEPSPRSWLLGIRSVFSLIFSFGLHARRAGSDQGPNDHKQYLKWVPFNSV